MHNVCHLICKEPFLCIMQYSFGTHNWINILNLGCFKNANIETNHMHFRSELGLLTGIIYQFGWNFN